MKPIMISRMMCYLLLLSLFGVLGGLTLQVAAQTVDYVDYSYRGAFVWSSDGRLAISSARGMWIYDVSTQTPRLVGTCDQATDAPSFSADHQLLAYAVRNADSYTLHLYRLDNGSDLFSASLEADFVTMTRFHNAGNIVAVLSGQYEGIDPVTTVSLLDLDARQFVRTLDFQIPRVQQIAWGTTVNELWAAGWSLYGEALYANMMDVNTGQIVFEFPMLGTDAEIDGEFALVGAVHLEDDFLVYYTGTGAYGERGFLILDQARGLQALGPANDSSRFDFEYLNRGLVLPYQPIVDFLSINRAEQLIALVERDTPSQFRLLNMMAQEIVATETADRRILSLDFNPEGTLLAVRTSTLVEDEQRLELWEVASMQRLTVLEVTQWQSQQCP